MTVTENMAPPPPTSFTVSVDELRNRAETIKEIDTKISGASGNEASLRKSVVDEIMTANSSEVNSLFEGVIAELRKQPPQVLVGFLNKLDEDIKGGTLKGISDEVVNTAVKERAASSESVNVDQLKEQRKKAVEMFKSMKTILESLDIDVSSVEEPKRSGGGRTAGSGSGGGTSTTAKTGKNKEGYRYTLNSEKGRPKSQNTFSSLAFYATKGLDMVGTDVSTLVQTDGKKLNAPALRAVVDASTYNGQPIKFGETDEWKITLPNGNVIGARRPTEQDKAELAWDEVAETPAQGEPAPATPEAPVVPETQATPAAQASAEQVAS